MTLKEWLKKNDLNQKAFAEMIGISPAYLSMVISGKVVAKTEMIDKIKEATKNQVTSIESSETGNPVSSVLPRHMREEIIQKYAHVINKL